MFPTVSFRQLVKPAMKLHFQRSLQRKRNRLPEYNYSQTGYYFVTICTKDKRRYFGKIKNGKIELNQIGKVAEKYWEDIPKHFSFAEMDEYIIMPNHIHGIIVIDNENTVDNNHGCYLQTRNMELLPRIISQYKSSVTRQIRKEFGDYSFAWQKSFYDRIIRNENELYSIRKYIRQNPLKWDLEKNNIENLDF